MLTNFNILKLTKFFIAGVAHCSKKTGVSLNSEFKIDSNGHQLSQQEWKDQTVATEFFQTTSAASTSPLHVP